MPTLTDTAKFGDVLFVQGNDFPSSIPDGIIRWWTSSQINHVAWCMGDGTVIEAIPRGVSQNLISEYDSKNYKFALLRPTRKFSKKEIDAITEFSFKQIGKGYDFRGLAGFVINRDIIDRNKWFCSELVCCQAETGNLILVPRKPAGIVVPDLVYQSLAFKVIMSTIPRDMRNRISSV